MLEIGTSEYGLVRDTFGARVLTSIRNIKRNKIFIIFGISDSTIDITIPNNHENLYIIPFNSWKVIGLGLFWWVASTPNEDPIVTFGYPGAQNAFGTMTAAITGGEKFNVNDHQKYDPLNILSVEVIAETSATLVTTWTPGAEFNVWETGVKRLMAYEAAVAGMTTGLVVPYLIIEVNTGGKW